MSIMFLVFPSLDRHVHFLQIDKNILFIITSIRDELLMVETSMTLNDPESSKYEDLVFFSRMNCADMAKDRSGQLANRKC